MGSRTVALKESVLPTTELLVAIQAIGRERYHHRHPFHLLMHDGKLTRGQLQAWVLNRHYYQSVIPIKDGVHPKIGSNTRVASVRAAMEELNARITSRAPLQIIHV